MRSLVGFLVLVTVLLVAAAIAVPALLKPVVAGAVRSALPFGGEAIDVDVDIDALGLLRGVVGEIHVAGSDLTREDVTIDRVDLTATDVGIGDHAAANVDGSLDGLDLVVDVGTSLRIGSIGLAGPSSALEATARFDSAQALAFVQRVFDEQGVSVGDIQLAEGGVSFVIFEQRVTVPLGVVDGALVVPDMLGGGPVELLAPRPEDPWRLTGVSITPDGLELDATVDGAQLLGSGTGQSGE